MRPVGVAGVILAAGFSRRLGRPKQLEVLGCEPLLLRAVRVGREADLEPLIVVSRPGLEMPPLPDGVLLAENDDAVEGMASSVRLGVRMAMSAGAHGVTLMTCDQPLLTRDHLRAVSAAPGRITASSYAGRKGVPAFFPASSFSDLLQLQGDSGARDLLRRAEAIPNEDLALDIDTDEDLRRARLLLDAIAG